MAKNRKILIALLFFTHLILTPALKAQTVVSKNVIASGGATISDGTIQLSSTVGQAAIGVASGATTIQKAGFWYQAGGIITNVDRISDALPAEFLLYQNYPNPFNPETEIRFQLPEACRVTLKIYNALGQEIITLADAVFPTGLYSAVWKSVDKNGFAVPSSIYFYRLEAQADSGEHFVATRKMSLLR